eukprot:359032-Chlamydomonas_euryale.AAC.8
MHARANHAHAVEVAGPAHTVTRRSQAARATACAAPRRIQLSFQAALGPQGTRTEHPGPSQLAKLKKASRAAWPASSARSRHVGVAGPQG